MAYINRGRDVLALIRKEGEQGVHKALVKIAEDNTILHQEMADMRKIMERVVLLMKQYEGALSGMGDVVEKLRNKYEPDNEANPNQKWS
jgi:hypothetical protein